MSETQIFNLKLLFFFLLDFELDLFEIQWKHFTYTLPHNGTLNNWFMLN